LKDPKYKNFIFQKLKSFSKSKNYRLKIIFIDYFQQLCFH